MNIDDKIKAVNSIADRLLNEYPFQFARLSHRFERWGDSTSRLFLEAMEKEGYELVKKCDGAESSGSTCD